MAIAPEAMSSQDEDKDNHHHDMVMPGFRFHPTEEELIEFYLRRKVEGKRFNVELITFLDLYRYDPWELPALAAIGEKEWYFYVPRDRKYRNGDRPNRVTTSGYWKATGADRMIRTESFRSIGLKKTLVFYSGKAPKGIRTSWIMNEYRLPQNEPDRYQKAEISLCRVYKRPGIEDHHTRIPASSSSTPSSSRGNQVSKLQQNMINRETTNFHVFEKSSPEKMNEADASSSTDNGTSLGLANTSPYGGIAPMTSTLVPGSSEEDGPAFLHHSRQVGSLAPNSTTLFTSYPSSMPIVDEFHRLVDYQQAYNTQQQQHHHQQPHHNQQSLTQFFPLPSQTASPALTTMANSIQNYSDKLWEWNLIPDVNRDYSSPFK